MVILYQVVDPNSRCGSVCCTCRNGPTNADRWPENPNDLLIIAGKESCQQKICLLELLK